MYTLAFALQLRKKHGKTSVRVAGTSVKVEYRVVENEYEMFINPLAPEFSFKF
jgi:hypothetical protein